MWDIALDTRTFDWIFKGNLDLQEVRDDQVIQQRIITRLRIQRGWINDPTFDQSLGSRLKQAVRLPRFRAMQEIALYVQEALDPMDDVAVENVTVEEIGANGNAVKLLISYRITAGRVPFVPTPIETLLIDLPLF